MTKRRVHLYPVFMLSIDVESEDNSSAVKEAVETFYAMLRTNGPTANWRFDKLHYADELDSCVVVDVLGESGNLVSAGAEFIPED